MKKNMEKLTAVFMAAVMAASLLSGCGSKKETAPASVPDQTQGEVKESQAEGTDSEGKTLRIYCWNEEFQARFNDIYADKLPADVKVEWVITPTQNNAYQDKLDQDLPNNEKVDADDRIDLFTVEADYILKYVDSDVTLDVRGDIGLTDEDLKNQYSYTQEIATDQSGKLKAVSWEADPGVFVYRRSIAKEVLGTDDPDKVQEAISDWNKFEEVAGKMKEKGYKMLSGYDDAYRVFSNNVSAPWVNANEEVVIDPMIDQWLDQTKDFTDKGYNNKTQLWSTDWNTDQGPAGKVFGFFYSTWGVNFTLLGNALETPLAEGGKKEAGNGIFGDYAICYGPASYYWGGTWICAARGTDNAELVKDIMYTMTCDSESMKKLTYDFEDFTNNQQAMQEISDSGYTSDFLGGQNHIELFLKVAPNVSMKNVTAYDQGITESFQTAMADYFNGQVTKEQAVDNFYTSVIEKYPNLKRPQ